jgi:hypothetical protein
MAISRFSTSRLTQGLPKYQTAWDSDNVEQGAMVPIATFRGTATTNGEQFTFSNIPQTYQDLMIVVHGTQTSTSGSATISINSLTGTPYSQTNLACDGATIASSRLINTNPASQIVHGSTTIPVLQVHHFLDYKNTSYNKTILTRHAHDKNGSGVSWITASVARTTSAITSIIVSSNQGGVYWGTDMTATLYGIKAGV